MVSFRHSNGGKMTRNSRIIWSAGHTGPTVPVPFQTCFSAPPPRKEEIPFGDHIDSDRRQLRRVSLHAHQRATGKLPSFSCRSGKEALDLALETPPDILILDLMLPELDGISLLQLLFASGIRPLVLATTKLYNDYVVDATAKLGVEYLMIKPCDIRAVVGRVKDLSNSLSKPSLSAPDRRTHVSNLLVSLGVSTKLRGYSYLREAVLYMADNPMASVTKELYPAVARRFGCSSSQVERAIRNAIQGAWSQHPGGAWFQIFQSDAQGIVPRPSNSSFISCLADRICLDQLEFKLPK